MSDSVEERIDETINLSIWMQVDRTDSRFTKPVSFGRKFTSIDPTYQLKTATALWGPYGDRWKMDNLSWRIIEPSFNEVQLEAYRDQMSNAASTKDQDKILRKMNPTLVLQAELIYPGGRFPVMVDMPFEQNDDCFKKLLTEARSKALSSLGFNADVFLGQFDDNRYVAQSREHFAQEDERFQAGVKMIAAAETVEDLDRLKENVVKTIKIVDQRDELLQRIEDRQQRMEVAFSGGSDS